MLFLFLYAVIVAFSILGIVGIPSFLLSHLYDIVAKTGTCFNITILPHSFI